MPLLGEPFAVYFQGGLTYAHGKYGIISLAVEELCKIEKIGGSMARREEIDTKYKWNLVAEIYPSWDDAFFWIAR